ncbi:MAG: pyrimidine-nucleoside phosphorylase [Glaciihabitans sp.]|nr:pyrimidine-nucleoside phosphorylase [Glaciihabitans sp.]
MIEPARIQSADIEPFDVVDLIHTKRDGGSLSTAQVNWMIDAYTRGYIADEQMAAMTMAIFLKGMERSEIRDLTLAMVDSGERLDFSRLRAADGSVKPTTDKHSTGGVGDKITLPLAPLVASFGVAVPQLSGRGLGHTGGTLDKLESIPGWRAHLSNEEFYSQLDSVGAVVCAAGAKLAPADGKLYALRDITGTVEAIPLIASSIMSKKIAEGTAALVLDVKFGSGAFMQDPARSRELAEAMVRLGTDAGVSTVALLTNMNVPLGLAIGNANEVRESVEVLAGGGPADVVELTLALATEMLALAGQPDADVAAALKDGRAMDTWRAMISAQGGDPDAAMPAPKESHVVTAERSGILVRQDALPFGVAAWRLGAGRARQQDPVQHGSGIDLHAKPGDTVTAGQPLFTLHTDEPARFERALEAVAGAFAIGDPGDEVSTGGPLIAGRVTA